MLYYVLTDAQGTYELHVGERMRHRVELVDFIQADGEELERCARIIGLEAESLAKITKKRTYTFNGAVAQFILKHWLADRINNITDEIPFGSDRALEEYYNKYIEELSKELADKKGISSHELRRRAIKLYKVITDHLEIGGEDISVLFRNNVTIVRTSITKNSL